MRALPALLVAVGCAYIDVGSDDPEPVETPGFGDDDDDGEPPSDVQCDEPYETPAPGAAGEGECVTGVIACGETVQGTNAGGSLVFSNEYEAAFEWCSGLGAGDDLSGPERVYLFEPPDDVDVVSVRLASCEPSQLLWYQTSQIGPEERVNCQYATSGGSTSQSDDILLSGSGIVWFVIEGLGNEGGNFTLTVECP